MYLEASKTICVTRYCFPNTESSMQYLFPLRILFLSSWNFLLASQSQDRLSGLACTVVCIWCSKCKVTGRWRSWSLAKIRSSEREGEWLVQNTISRPSAHDLACLSWNELWDTHLLQGTIFQHSRTQVDWEIFPTFTKHKGKERDQVSKNNRVNN